MLNTCIHSPSHSFPFNSHLPLLIRKFTQGIPFSRSLVVRDTQPPQSQISIFSIPRLSTILFAILFQNKCKVVYEYKLE